MFWRPGGLTPPVDEIGDGTVRRNDLEEGHDATVRPIGQTMRQFHVGFAEDHAKWNILGVDLGMGELRMFRSRCQPMEKYS